MATFVRDPEPIELQELREYREQHDLDHWDEVWEGVLHMNPIPTGEHQHILQQLAVLLDPLARRAGLVLLTNEFGLGRQGKSNFRVPDGGLHRALPRGVYQTTAALVIEVVSPGDESWKKFDFYAAHDVDELLIIDHKEQQVHWFALCDGEYKPVERSALIELGPAELAEQLDWP
ncbi:MAG TPA: Uma2 family endonuclease [Solirubrobacteraceae bacterium]|jgi:Uma2 family endonuclease|nr:Uma2 family endonuclease [Solirubrobacteraceae bacterium]